MSEQQTIEYARSRVIERRRVRVGDTRIRYSVFQDGDDNPSGAVAFWDEHGRVYISSKPFVASPLFVSDLIALHERNEARYLQDQGVDLRASIYGQRNREAYAYAHSMAHWDELNAAHRKGVLDEFLSYRPYEMFTDDMYGLVTSSIPEESREAELKRVVENNVEMWRNS